MKVRQSDSRKLSAFGVRAALGIKEAQIRTSERQTHGLPLLSFPLGCQSAPGFVFADPPQCHVEIVSKTFLVERQEKGDKWKSRGMDGSGVSTIRSLYAPSSSPIS